MRKLGDDYVKHEFKLHKKTTNQAHLTGFFGAWESYLQSMQKSKDKFGKSLEESDAKKLNDEQRIKLAQLQEEAKSI